jgi:hypothetical protein
VQQVSQMQAAWCASGAAHDADRDKAVFRARARPGSLCVRLRSYGERAAWYLARRMLCLDVALLKYHAMMVRISNDTTSLDFI